MTFTADSKRQRLPLIFYSFVVILSVQRAEDRRQKFHFCRLLFAVNVMHNLSNVNSGFFYVDDLTKRQAHP